MVLACVSSIHSMFNDAVLIDQIVSGWDDIYVTNMLNMLRGNIIFLEYLNVAMGVDVVNWSLLKHAL